jgi:5'-methylthioadenosine phosphorylase
MIFQNLSANAETAKRIVRDVISKIPEKRAECPCPQALEKSIATDPTRTPASTKQKLDLLVGKYLK